MTFYSSLLFLISALETPQYIFNINKTGSLRANTRLASRKIATRENKTSQKSGNIPQLCISSLVIRGNKTITRPAVLQRIGKVYLINRDIKLIIIKCVTRLKYSHFCILLFNNTAAMARNLNEKRPEPNRDFSSAKLSSSRLPQHHRNFSASCNNKKTSLKHKSKYLGYCITRHSKTLVFEYPSSSNVLIKSPHYSLQLRRSTSIISNRVKIKSQLELRIKTNSPYASRTFKYNYLTHAKFNPILTLSLIHI